MVLTALMWASGKGHGAIVEALLQAGADVNRTANNGTTALMMASEEGHAAMWRPSSRQGLMSTRL